MSRAKSNPLSTRFVQPGRIAWQASQSRQCLDSIADRFVSQLNCRAAIVGPHGSGKSTLIAHLVPLLGNVVLKRATFASPEPQGTSSGSLRTTRDRQVDGSIVWLQMRGRGASARLLKETRTQWCQPNRLLIIDGYEQLSLFSRAMLVWVTERNSVGLLVTSHCRTRLPTLIETKVDVALAQQLLEQLLPADLPGREEHIKAERLSQLLEQHHGNLREVFMQLYDDIELVSRSSRVRP